METNHAIQIETPNPQSHKTTPLDLAPALVANSLRSRENGEILRHQGKILLSNGTAAGAPIWLHQRGCLWGLHIGVHIVQTYGRVPVDFEAWRLGSLKA